MICQLKPEVRGDYSDGLLSVVYLDGNGEVCEAIFRGPFALQRAQEYCSWLDTRMQTRRFRAEPVECRTITIPAGKSSIDVPELGLRLKRGTDPTGELIVAEPLADNDPNHP